MRCPHCNYVHNEMNEFNEWVEGEHGDFYTNDVSLMLRGAGLGIGDVESKLIKGCPKCNKLFML